MPLKVLIAEDETLIAFDLAYVVEEAGHIVVGPCASLAQVKKAAAAVTPDLALIDVMLGNDSGKGRLRLLTSRVRNHLRVRDRAPEFSY
jgi:DNA-binding response OmpR family regulator